ncbi:hypothetical protein [Kordiimonas sp.]|uniref:hypothetical protein n=1 Tax=Kordiimonas sp. TaxID=1970157 RepID=UPI003A8D9A37
MRRPYAAANGNRRNDKPALALLLGTHPRTLEQEETGYRAEKREKKGENKHPEIMPMQKAVKNLFNHTNALLAPNTPNGLLPRDPDTIEPLLSRRTIEILLTALIFLALHAGPLAFTVREWYDSAVDPRRQPC